MKKTNSLCLLLLCGSMFLAGCTNQNSQKTKEEASLSSNTIVTYENNDYDTSYDDEDAQLIKLNNNTINCESSSVEIKQSTITIKKAGTYVLEGTLNDGNMIVDADKKAVVHIVLNNTSITSSSTSPLFVKKADKVILTLANKSKNTLTDTLNELDVVDNEPNAALFSKADLTINGKGSLNVNANYNNAVQCKDTLKIMSGNIQINARNHGIIGKDLLAVHGGDINIEAKGDGLRSTNTNDDKAGCISIEGGTLRITAAQDGIQAENEVYIYDGTISITAGGTHTAGTKQHEEKGFNPFEEQESSNDENISTKGIKAIKGMHILGGKINVDSSDDAIHCNNAVTIKNGTLKLASGDDGIHSDTTLTIQKGNITISDSYEGLEAESIQIEGGNIHVKASDDGVNASGNSPIININGGYLYVYADGDGLDSNKDITMSNGTVIIDGCESGDNGALDFDGTFDISGGTLIASGSMQMLQYPTSVSNGNLAVIAFDSTTSDMIHLQNQDTNDILTLQPSHSYQVITFYSSALKQGDTISIYTKGNAIAAQDGLQKENSYQNGSLYKDVTITDNVTIVGTIPSMGKDMKGGVHTPPNEDMQKGPNF